MKLYRNEVKENKKTMKTTRKIRNDIELKLCLTKQILNP